MKFPRMHCCFTILMIASALPTLAAEPQAASHPPLYSAPSPANRPLPKGPVYFVDPERGDDDHEGSQAASWRTIGHAVNQLKAGDTLCLRGGTYYENVVVSQVGRVDAPITIRSFKGEQAVIDGALPEFFVSPAEAWEPVQDGVKGEYRSSRAYPGIRDVMGAFGDSMIGFHTYYHAKDLRATNELWDPEKPGDKDSDVKPVYCGPGLWYDSTAQRIHVRLAHTHLPDINNYRGETDPRKLPLVVAPFRSVPLRLDGARHVRLQDLVVRGGGFNTIVMHQSHEIELDNLTVWCSTYGLRANGVQKLKIEHCGFYGSIPPWTFRSDESLRSYPGKPFRDISRFNTHAILVPDCGREFDVYYMPVNNDWEISHCDFAGAHDGLYLGAIDVKFHHNRVRDLQDDGIYLSPMYARPGMMPPAELHLYQNHISNCLTALAFGGSEAVNKDKVYVYRNVLDLRGDVPTGRPSSGDEHCRFTPGHPAGDHGSPPWSSMFAYHNTLIMRGPARGSDMAVLSDGSPDRPRSLFNNLFIHLDRLPALKPGDFERNAVSDGNLYWSPDASETVARSYFTKFRASSAFESGKKLYAAGFESHSLVADPRLMKLATDATGTADYRLQPASPAANAGVTVPAEWADPLRAQDKGQPDIGAFPLGAEKLDAGRIK